MKLPVQLQFITALLSSALFFITTNSFAAPITGTFTIGVSPYTSIAVTIGLLNTNGVTAPGATFNVPAGYTETLASGAGGINLITSPSSVSAPLIFQKSGAGANPIITAAASQGGTQDYIIKLNSTDYVTFDGINLTAGDNTTEYGVHLLGAVGDGCQHNTFQNMTITLDASSRTLATTIGIYVQSTATSAAGENSNNSFFNNTINNALKNGYYFQGISSALQDVGNQVGTTGGGISKITNYGNNSTAMYGIYMQFQGSYNIFNTLIDNTGLNWTGTGLTYGIFSGGNSPIPATTNSGNIFGNTISNLQNTNSGLGSSITCLFTTTTGTINFHDNIISTITAAFGAGTGIQINGGGTYNIYNNKFNSIVTTSASNTTATGVTALGSTVQTMYIYNNMFADIRANSCSSGLDVRAINIGNTGASSYYVYYNSVYMNGTSTVASHESAGLFLGSTTPTLDFRDNIIVNNYNEATGTRAVAFYASSTTYTNITTTSNNNLLYSTGTGTHFLFWDGTNGYNTIAGYKGQMLTSPVNATRETNAVSGDPLFISSSSPYNLHITSGSGSPATSAGAPITNGVNGANITIATDIDADTRAATTPDIGADQFTLCTAPTVTVTPNAAQICTGGTTLTASGTATTFTWAPSTGLSATTGTTVTATPPIAGTYTVTGSTSPTCTATTTVVAVSALSGTYTIDNTVVAAASLFPNTTTFNSFTAAAAALNCGGVSANVTFNVVSGQTFTEAPVDITYLNGGGFTITFIKSGVLANPVLKGTGGAGAADPILEIDGGDKYTFDGIDFTANNNTVEYGIYLKGLASNGCQNNTFQNLVVTLDKSNANNTYGVWVQSAATSAPGENNNNSFFNNTVQNIATAGYYFNGISTTFPDAGNQVGTTGGGKSKITNFGYSAFPGATDYGIWLQHQTAYNVFNTLIDNNGFNIGTSGITYCILNGTSPIAATVNYGNIYGNTISNVKSTATGAVNTITYGILSATGVNTANAMNIHDNRIQNIYSAASLVEGIDTRGAGTQYIYNNFIDSIYTNSSNGSIAAGVNLAQASSTIYLYNNMIYNIASTNSTVNAGVLARGIAIVSTSSTNYVYNNSIYLNGTSTNASLEAAALYVATTVTTADLRNNIIYCNYNVTTGVRSVALYLSTSTNTCISANSNNNLVYAGTASSSHLLFYDGTNAIQNIGPGAGTYKTLLSPRESNSITGDPGFISSTYPYNLHINISLASIAESAGTPITNGVNGSLITIATDIDGGSRSATTPDVGADEFCALPGTPSAPSGTTARCIGAGTDTYTTSAIGAASYTWSVTAAAGSVSGTGTAATVTWSATYTGTATVSVTAVSSCSTNSSPNSVSVAVNPALGAPPAPTGTTTLCKGSAPTVYTTSSVSGASSYNWTVSGAGNSVAGTGISATVTWGGAFSGTASVSVSANGTCGPSSSNATTVTVNAPLNGIYTIDNTATGAALYPTGTSFNSFTTAAAALSNCGGITGNVTFNVVSGQTFTEAPVSITYVNAGGFTITFQKSGVLANPVLKGTGGGGTTDAILQITSGDKYTFDGIDFTANNNTVEYGIWLLGTTGDGCQNNTVKNSTITLDKTNANNTFGVLVQSAATSAAGENNNNSFFNNTVQNIQNGGYYFQGISTALPDAGNQVGTSGEGVSRIKNFGYFGGGGVACEGIWLQHQTTASVFNTLIDNKGTTIQSNTFTYCILNATNPIGATVNTASIFGNTISNVANTENFTGIGGAVYGILSNTGVSSTIHDNVIRNVSAGAGVCVGLDSRGLGTTTIFNNVVDSIYNISPNGGVVVGINTAQAGTQYIYNNMVYDLGSTNSSNNAGALVKGISVGNAAGGSCYVFNNTVYLNGTSSNPSLEAAALFVTTTVSTCDMRNNILYNNFNVTTGVRAVALYFSNNTYTGISANCNNNLVYAGTASASHLLFYDGTNSVQNIGPGAGTYKTVTSPREANSVTGNPGFLNSAYPYNVHINPAVFSLAESGGITISTGGSPVAPVTITTDIDGDTRNATTPDIGADEFCGVPATPSAPAGTLTRCQGAGTTVLTTSALGAATYTWSVSGAGSSSVSGTGSSATVTWDAAFAGTATVSVMANSSCATSSSSNSSSVVVNLSPASPATPSGTATRCKGGGTDAYTISAVAGATSYNWSVSGAGNSIAGTSTSGTVTWGAAFSGTASVSVTASSTCGTSSAATTIVTVNYPLNGTYTIDNTATGAALYPTGTSFNSFTTAAAALSNCGGITGAVTFNVVSGETFNEAPVVIGFTNPSGFAINFLKSGVSANPILKGSGGTGAADAILELDGGDKFTFDGIDFTAKDTAAEYGIFLKGLATNGCQNNTFQNSTVTMSRLAFINTSYGVYVLSAATSAAGENSTNHFYNNTVQNLRDAGYIFSGVTANPDNGNEVGITGGGTSTIKTYGNNFNFTFFLYGVNLVAQTNAKVFSTTIDNSAASIAVSGATTYGINDNGNSVNTVDIYSNTITNITNTNTVLGGSVVGIMITALNTNVYNNTIKTLSGAFGSANGIQIVNSGNATIAIYKNIIHDINNGSNNGGVASAITSGIAGPTLYIYNNMIYDIRANNSTGVCARAILLNGTGANSKDYVYYNTIYLNAVSINAAHESAGLYLFGNPVSIDLRNNIIVNNTDETVGTRAVALYRGTTSYANYTNTSNRNLYYAGGPATAKNYLLYDGTNAMQTLANFKTFINTQVPGAEQSSVSENPPFVSATGTIDLHLNQAIYSQADASALPISSPIAITDDIDGDPRNLVAPDMGADEFCGITGPAATIVGTTPVCQGQNGVTYSIPVITNATGYNWTLPAGAAITAGSNTNSITVNFSTSAASGSQSITVIGTNSCGNGTVSPTYALTVNPLPSTPGAIASSNGGDVVCQGETGVNYNVPSIGNATGYTWTLPTGATISAGSNTNTITVSYSLSAVNGNVTVTGLNACGSGLNTATFAVIVNAVPTVSVTPLTNNTCAGDDINLTASGTTATYTWAPSAGLDATSGAAITASPVVNTTYTVTATNANGCTQVATSAFTVKPTPNVNISPNSAVCTGGTTATLVASGAVSYTWSPTTNLTPSAGTSATETAQISALTIYTVVGTGSNGCTASDVVPVATVAVGGTISPVFSIICSGGTKLLTVSGAAGHDYQWQISGDNSSWTPITGATNTTYTTNTTDGNTNKYYRLLAQSNSCWNVASTTAEVDVSQPIIPITASGLTDNSVNLNWLPIGQGNYNISYTGTSSGTVLGTTPPKIVTGLTANGSYTITLNQTGTGLGGCPASGTVNINTLCPAPPTVTVISTGTTSITLSWSGGAGNYRVYYRPLYAYNGYFTRDVINGTSTTLTTQGGTQLYHSVTYEVYVTRLDCPGAGNIGQPSSKVYATTTPALSCATPTIDSVRSLCPVQIEVWVHGSPTNQYYIDVERLTPTVQPVTSYPVTGSYFTMNVSAGQNYLISARSICGGGVSNLAIWPGTLQIKPQCTAVANLLLSNPTCSGFTASWNADQCIANNASYYQLFLRQVGTINWNGYGVTIPTFPIGPYKLVNWLGKGKTFDVFAKAVYSCNGYLTYGATTQTLRITTLSAGCREEATEDPTTQAITQQTSLDNSEVFSLYPNPNNGQFTVDLSRLNTNEDAVRIEVSNMLGQTILTHLTSISDGHLTEFINLPASTTAGTYVVRLTAGKNVYTGKMNISK